MNDHQHHPNTMRVEPMAHSHEEHDHAAMDHGGHDGHGGHEGHVEVFRKLFWVMLALSIPVLAFNSMFTMLIGITLPESTWIPWVSPILGTVMYIWGGRPFLSGARDEIKARKPGMMLLIALGITVAFLSSWGASLGILDHGLDFWWELALLVVIMLLGHWIEMRSLAQTTSALDSLAALLPDTAERVVDGEIQQVSPEVLELGDIVMVRPGGRIPADGTITEGTAELDESMITGESRTVSRGPGDPVVAGTVSTDTAVRVQVTAIGADTALAGIQRLVADAQSSSSRAQRVADTAAGWLFWFALGSAVVTATIWSLLGDPDAAVIRTITVLVIACPHALGLAIPLVVSIATERAAKGGVLIKDRLALEGMRQVSSVLFDKTGTLTVGEPVVIEVSAVPGHSENQVLALAAAAESDSEHPLAKAIMRAADERKLQLSPATDFRSSPAEGVQASVDGASIGVGGPHLLATHGLDPLEASEAWKAHGATILHVIANGRVIGALALADEIRPESRAAVDALHARGVEVVMITGDAEAVAESVGRELGIDRVFAGVRPENKAAKVAELQAEGRKVAMVGDGVNDAPALAQADVGIAIGAGTDVAIASAGVILASDDPRSVLSILDLSQASYRKMKQNLWWAAGYNLVSVPLAAGVLAGIGFILPMSVGAVLMSISTVVVALNAQLLRRLDLRPGAGTEAQRT
ncbi:heavy metal translocating P-type ATPase [Paeniglutamicibacter gangotriensis]|uniref:Heavy metal translocating P-type ATPase n=1 Tax=Paeniglutamicibacter gangotriensis TaxID=254787 RepID=A0A5B0ELF2_9MICC|nr:heavy metal translocating P-type ATPase [Paeniglutamicibacter gangotriensis]KAA0978985.1 heavy metal translocating P-type ATPase [Paeniglutamicibacter gangotriensis]